MNSTKILVSDDVSESGLEPLRAAGFVVEKRTGLKPDELRAIIHEYDGLVVRSETKVTAEVLDAGLRLRAIGRAGVGVDNIDVAAATARGVIVMNAPDGNTMTTAEHTVALLLALARRVPQASASLRAGKWERKSFVGVELRGKTLGVVGLGRIGRVVASRALAFEMKVVAFDPFIAPEQLANTEVEFAPLAEVCARADFLTVHTPLTAETRGIIGARVINCARGGLVDERALYDALSEGRIAGAALDVFEQEPPAAGNPLVALGSVIATPHLGASTVEAQEGVAVTVAEQMRDYFQTGALRGAVNAPSLGAQELNVLQPYLTLGERLGRFQAQLVDEAVREVGIEYAGDLAAMDAAPVTRAFLAGLLRDMSARVNVVNAFLIAEERGIKVTTAYRHAGAGEMSPAITTRVATAAGAQTVSGAMFGVGEGRITEIDGFHVEAVPAGHVLVTRSRDVPGVIGRVGTILGARGVNISRFHLGRRTLGGEAIAVVETDARVDDATLAEILSTGQVFSARRVQLDP
jgi:D-3-phosphoglycerate dehydrogenase